MTDCILWDGPTIETHGNVYGRLPGKEMVLAHRVAYEKEYGPISDGLVIDHLCRVGLCVNPLHLEAVDNLTNILRGEGAPAKNARKTHCHNNHEFTKENTHVNPSGKRICKTCRRDYDRSRSARGKHSGQGSGR